MPLELTDVELATVAKACRAMAYQEGDRAKNMENSTTRGLSRAASVLIPATQLVQITAP